MPAAAKPRWITVRTKFDYRWPGVPAITAYQPGELYAKAEVADFAVGRGYATEGKADGSDATAPKTRRRRKKATSAPKSATAKADAGPVTGTNARVGGTDLAADDSAGAGEPVAPAAE